MSLICILSMMYWEKPKEEWLIFKKKIEHYVDRKFQFFHIPTYIPNVREQNSNDGNCAVLQNDKWQMKRSKTDVNSQGRQIIPFEEKNISPKFINNFQKVQLTIILTLKLNTPFYDRVHKINYVTSILTTGFTFEAARHEPVTRWWPVMKLVTGCSRAKVKNYGFLAIN